MIIRASLGLGVDSRRWASGSPYAAPPRESTIGLATRPVPPLRGFAAKCAGGVQVGCKPSIAQCLISCPWGERYVVTTDLAISYRKEGRWLNSAPLLSHPSGYFNGSARQVLHSAKEPYG